MGKPNIAIIGLGRIGRELYKKLWLQGYRIPIIVEKNKDKSGIYTDFNLENKIAEPENYLELFKKSNIDIACLTIPTSDQGETARDYIISCASNGLPVVTSEKGALGNFYPELKKYVDNGMIGYRATVGGGSRILPFLKEQGDDIKEIHVINNGTLNYISQGLSLRMNLEYLIEKSKENGYAEPGASNALDIFNNEICNDVPKKTVIIYSTANLGPAIRASDIKVNPLTEEQFQNINHIFYRFMVSFYKNESHESPEKNEDIIGGFKHKTENCFISAGFKYIPSMHYCHPLPKGVNNAGYICKGKNPKELYTVSLFGPGAGPDPTTDSMEKDMEELA